MNESRRVDVLAELRQLREENDRLKSLLTAHGIPWWERRDSGVDGEKMPRLPHTDAQHLDTAAKVSLFRRLFRGRSDIYAIRWESAKAKSGYALACDNEWQPGVCGKPRLKCADCDQRKLLPVTDQVIYDHLAGKHTVGVYPPVV